MLKDGLKLGIAVFCLVGGSACDSPAEVKPEETKKTKVAAKTTAKTAAATATAEPKAAAAAQPNAQPAADPYAQNKFGLPAVIPTPGSKAPTVAEWNAVPKEVTVRGSTALNCETKMLREWLRVTCRKSQQFGEPLSMDIFPSGQKAFMFPPDGTAAGGMFSVVVQVVRNKTFGANMLWVNGHRVQLSVEWPNGAPDPTIALKYQS